VVRRYAGDEAQQVVVIGALEAPPRGRRGATTVDVTRATVIAADPLDGDTRAEAWLKSDAGGFLRPALAVLNHALHARRIAAADPYASEVAPRHALVTRVGYGTGEQVAEGRWTAARELPPERSRVARESALRPQERFAALLAARDVALACELLALRARLDLDHGRPREAALQLEAALAAAVSELEGWRELPGMPERLEELRGFGSGVAAVAAAARTGAVAEDGRVVVAAALGRLEAALRARTAGASF
jgi:hypothetical protein